MHCESVALMLAMLLASPALQAQAGSPLMPSALPATASAPASSGAVAVAPAATPLTWSVSCAP